MKNFFLIIGFFFYFSIQLFSQNEQPCIFQANILKLNTAGQLLDSNSISVCQYDSINLEILVSCLDSTYPTKFLLGASLYFSNPSIEVFFPNAPNNYTTAILTIALGKPIVSQNFISFYIEIDSSFSMYGTFDVRYDNSHSFQPKLKDLHDTLKVDYQQATYDWYFNGNLILANSNSNFFVPKASGSYQVLVKSNCDTTFSNKLIYYMTNINEILNINYQTLFYPNPFYDKIYFIENLIPKNSEIEIFDTYGRLVYSADQIENEIDLTFLSSGFYVFKIGQRNGKKQTFSILKSEHY